MRRDETYVHVAIRNYLRREGWTLLAGQYPGGSDDELHVFNVFDPALAKDGSPDHRRHSFGKLVPDLIAYKAGSLLIIEAKPEYSPTDKAKLDYLLSERREDFIHNFDKFIKERGVEIPPLAEVMLIPALAFLSEYIAPSDGLVHFKVIDLDNVEVENLQR